MSADGTSTKVMLMLGAGFSRAAGLPIMSEFGQLAWHRDRMRRLDDASACSAQELRNAGAIYAAFQEFCGTAHELVATNAANLEEVFTVAELLNEAGVPRLRIAGQDVAMSDLIDQMRLWLWNIYQALPDVFEHDTAKVVTTLYRGFVAPFARLGNRLTVVTMNYDVLFEHVARHIAEEPMPIRYPWRARPVWVKREDDSYLETSDKASLICKIHGSVNYFEGHGCPPDDRRGPLDPDGSWFGVSSETVHAGDSADDWAGSGIVASRAPYPATVALGTIWRIRHDRYAAHGPPTPVIIPPTYAKLTARPWLRETWAAATNALMHARLLIVVGYSLPVSDGFMRGMMQGALARRQASPELRQQPLTVFVVDPSDAVLARYREAFQPLTEQGRVTTRRRSLEQWEPSRDADFMAALGEATR